MYSKESRRLSNNKYDKYKRDQESRRFYKSNDWLRCRELVLIRDKHLCQRCLDNKRITKADVVHHIKELKDYPELGLEESNLVSLCHKCHNNEHKKGKKQKNESAVKIDFLEFKENEELL